MIFKVIAADKRVITPSIDQIFKRPHQLNKAVQIFFLHLFLIKVLVTDICHFCFKPSVLKSKHRQQSLTIKLTRKDYKMTQSGTQRTLKYRSLKIASEFSSKHLEGVDYTSIDEFICAKQTEAEIKHNVKLTSFDDGLLKLFMAEVEDLEPHKYNDSIYAVTDLLKVWKICLREVQAV